MQAPARKTDLDRRIVRAACPHDCPDTCALAVTVENGVAVKVEGAKDHPFTAGRRNANHVTSQAITDIGRGATFYDCLVEVEKAG